MTIRGYCRYIKLPFGVSECGFIVLCASSVFPTMYRVPIDEIHHNPAKVVIDNELINNFVLGGLSGIFQICVFTNI